MNSKGWSQQEQTNLLTVLENFKTQYGSGIDIKIDEAIEKNDNPFNVRITDHSANLPTRKYCYTVLKTIIAQQNEPYIRDVVLKTEDPLLANSSVTIDI